MVLAEEPAVLIYNLRVQIISSKLSYHLSSHWPKQQGAPVPQQVKHQPADLAVPVLNPARDGNIFTHKQGRVYRLSLSPYHHPDMTEILLSKGSKIAGHPSIPK